jgi:DNA (cytosine-5)-methyltransferase 1
MESAPIWTDLKTFPWESFRDRVDILTGGYPCQPFSAAGKRAGKEDPRHLWPWIADGIRILRPRVCFFENVEGHISLGLSSVISDLEELGYKVSWGIFSASEVGAPHQRKRVFILAHSSSHGHDGWPIQDGVCGRSVPQLPQPLQGECAAVRSEVEGCCDMWPSRPGEPQHGWEPPRVVGNSSNEGHSGAEGQSGSRAERKSNGHSAKPVDDNRRQAQPPLGGNSDGPADWLDYAELYTTCDNRTDELRLLGNGVVPATAERAFRTLLTELLTNQQP